MWVIGNLIYETVQPVRDAQKETKNPIAFAAVPALLFPVRMAGGAGGGTSDGVAKRIGGAPF